MTKSVLNHSEYKMVNYHTAVHICCCIMDASLANGMNPDQIVPYRAVWSGPILFTCKLDLIRC